MSRPAENGACPALPGARLAALFLASGLTGVSHSENVALDLESFSHHAGRTTVTTDDVLLLARRNQDLYGIIKESVDEQKAAKAKGKSKR